MCFCLAYARLAPSRRPAGTLLLALGCAAVAGLLGTLCGNVWLTAGLTAAVTVAGLLTWTADDQGHRRPDQSRARAWEIPMRMALSGVTVLTAVTAAGVLGSFVGGVLSALPVLLGIMAPSLHSSVGPPAAAGLLRGALGSAIGTLCFLLVLGVSLVPLGSVAAFAFALAAMLAARPLMRLVTPPTDH
ncbi:hypothetical protein ACFWIW_26945 [Amycolatopsis sp. NPDC058340]|uniref:hypothetical protein n=1 Tax=Amycolatopsis sp. NPDC058340 TaxID=3346453 RepID=UPI0036694463